jgi:transposase
MPAIPVSLTEEQFATYIEPHLSKAKRGFVSREPLYQIFNYVFYALHTGCQWEEVPLKRDSQDRPVMSWQVPRYHFYKWCKDGSFERLFTAGILTIRYELDVSVLNLDGSHSAAKKGAKRSPIKAARKPKPAIVFR